MNQRALVAQTRKLAEVAKFAYGEPVHVSIDMDCDSHSRSYPTPRSAPPKLQYRVYAANPVGESVRYKSTEWKDVLALITWLEDIEYTVSLRSK
jgi:hypothetical protein